MEAAADAAARLGLALHAAHAAAWQLDRGDEGCRDFLLGEQMAKHPAEGYKTWDEFVAGLDAARKSGGDQ
jgi:hypothetical protein